jgi:hypothetical protein
MTGGGGGDFTISGYTAASAPYDNRTWAVLVFTDNTTVESPDDVTASVVCYNSQGKVKGAITTTSTQQTKRADIPADLLDRVRHQAAAQR